MGLQSWTSLSDRRCMLILWCHSHIVTVLLLPFQFWCLLFYFFICLVAMVRTSNTTLNISDESGHSCLVPDFREVFQFFIFEYDISSGFGMALLCWHMFPLYSCLWVFIMNRFWILPNDLLLLLRWLCYFIIPLLIWHITLTDLQILNHPFILGINLTWLCYMILLIKFWISFCNILLRIFGSLLIRGIGL